MNLRNIVEWVKNDPKKLCCSLLKSEKIFLKKFVEELSGLRILNQMSIDGNLIKDFLDVLEKLHEFSLWRHSTANSSQISQKLLKQFTHSDNSVVGRAVNLNSVLKKQKARLARGLDEIGANERLDESVFTNSMIFRIDKSSKECANLSSNSDIKSSDGVIKSNESSENQSNSVKTSTSLSDGFSMSDEPSSKRQKTSRFPITTPGCGKPSLSTRAESDLSVSSSVSSEISRKVRFVSRVDEIEFSTLDCPCIIADVIIFRRKKEFRPQTHWRIPKSWPKNPTLRSERREFESGRESKEKLIQAKRIRSVLEAIYPSGTPVPFSPTEPPSSNSGESAGKHHRDSKHHHSRSKSRSKSSSISRSRSPSISSHREVTSRKKANSLGLRRTPLIIPLNYDKPLRPSNNTNHSVQFSHPHFIQQTQCGTQFGPTNGNFVCNSPIIGPISRQWANNSSSIPPLLSMTMQSQSHNFNVNEFSNISQNSSGFQSPFINNVFQSPVIIDNNNRNNQIQQPQSLIQHQSHCQNFLPPPSHLNRFNPSFIPPQHVLDGHSRNINHQILVNNQFPFIPNGGISPPFIGPPPFIFANHQTSLESQNRFSRGGGRFSNGHPSISSSARMMKSSTDQGRSGQHRKDLSTKLPDSRNENLQKQNNFRTNSVKHSKQNDLNIKTNTKNLNLEKNISDSIC